MKQRTLDIVIGKHERAVSESELRKLQTDLMSLDVPDGAKALLDALISHVVCGRPNTWRAKEALT